jgi:hypothetical protein
VGNVIEVEGVDLWLENGVSILARDRLDSAPR